MTYDVAKLIHLIGMIILVGNVTSSALWKFFADRTRDLNIIAFAQRLITLTDWCLTLWGVILMTVGGYSAAVIGHLDLLSDRWLLIGQGLFLVSGVIWVSILVPLQIRMNRTLRAPNNEGKIPEAYMRLSRAWFVIGVIATVPLIAAAWVMVSKPY